MGELTFRAADENDVGLVLEFIKSIAEYEKMSDEVVTTKESLREWMFERKVVEVFFAVLDGKEIGFALYYTNFSTFTGRGGLYVEDVFIHSQYRGNGYGKAIFKRLASIALSRGCPRMEWQCLNWNTPSIAFYLSMGAVPMKDWTVYRLTPDTMQAFIDKA